MAKGGTGTLTLSGSKAYSGNTAVNAGTLRFALTGSSTIGAAATATVSSGATLELAGSVSALSSGTNRVNITNNSSSPGLLISGTHQQVGNIDGSGTTQINAGSDLTANRIVQGALVIGGTSTTAGLLTIDASDSLGNPLTGAEAPPFSAQLSAPFGGTGSFISIAGAATLNTVSAASPLAADRSPSGDLGHATVPEPSSIMLLALGAIALARSFQPLRPRMSRCL